MVGVRDAGEAATELLVFTVPDSFCLQVVPIGLVATEVGGRNAKPWQLVLSVEIEHGGFPQGNRKLISSVAFLQVTLCSVSPGYTMY